MKRLIILLLTSCQVAETYDLLQVPPSPKDGGTMSGGDASVRRDAGMMMGRDAGPMDALPPVPRELTTYRILGNTPIDNLVMNPQLDLHTTLTLFGFGDPSFGQRYHLPDSPSELPVLEIMPNNGALLPVQSRPVVLDVSIWVGDKVDGMARPEVMLSGLLQDGTVHMASLAPVGPTSGGEIMWQHYAG